MATQPMFIAPDNIQARIARVKNRPLAVQPKRISDGRILVHRCFNQLAGKSKPTNCSCKDRIEYTDALSKIARGEAHWLLVHNPKTTTLVDFHRAIVEAIPFERQIRPIKELQNHNRRETGILGKFRKLVLAKFTKGNLPQSALNISDCELRAYLAEPTQFRERFPEFCEPKLWAKLLSISTEFFLNHTATETVSIEAGKYLSGAPQGRGRVITGGYNSAKLDRIAGFDLEFAREAGNLKELASRVVPSGHGPDVFESNGGFDD